MLQLTMAEAHLIRSQVACEQLFKLNILSNRKSNVAVNVAGQWVRSFTGETIYPAKDSDSTAQAQIAKYLRCLDLVPKSNVPGNHDELTKVKAAIDNFANSVQVSHTYKEQVLNVDDFSLVVQIKNADNCPYQQSLLTIIDEYPVLDSWTGEYGLKVKVELTEKALIEGYSLLVNDGISRTYETSVVDAPEILNDQYLAHGLKGLLLEGEGLDVIYKDIDTCHDKVISLYEDLNTLAVEALEEQTANVANRDKYSSEHTYVGDLVKLSVEFIR